MGSKFHVSDVLLVNHWKKRLYKQLNKDIQDHDDKSIINLASQEYSSAIDKDKLDAKWIDITFKELKNNQFKTIGIYAKKARGAMARYIIKNAIDHVDKLRYFSEDGYAFNPELSSLNNLCFIR